MRLGLGLGFGGKKKPPVEEAGALNPDGSAMKNPDGSNVQNPA
jgi:hypothetical protein